jgi:hypothetical protein
MTTSIQDQTNARMTCIHHEKNRRSNNGAPVVLPGREAVAITRQLRGQDVATPPLNTGDNPINSSLRVNSPSLCSL